MNNIVRKILSGIFKTQARPQPEPVLELNIPVISNKVTNCKVTEILSWPSVRSRTDISLDIEVAGNILENVSVMLDLTKKIENLAVTFIVTPVGLEIQLSDDKNKPVLMPNIQFQKTTPGDDHALGLEASRIMEELEKIGFSFNTEYLALGAFISMMEAWNPEAQVNNTCTFEPKTSAPKNQIR